MMAFLHYVLIFVLSLPVAIWILAAVYSLIDDTDIAQAITKISLRFLAVLALVYLAGGNSAGAIGYAFATVIVLHLAYFWIIRWLIARGILITDAHE